MRLTVDSPHSNVLKMSLSLVLGTVVAAGSALTAQTPMNHASRPAKPSAEMPAASPVVPPAQVFPTPLIQQPPSQADIEASPERLTIKASNASLTQTLQRIADKTGMHLEGVSGDERVFGSFGPGAPRDVLTALLNGTSYNMIMVGSLDNGAPRQLLLSAKSSSAPAVTAPPAPPQSTDDDTAEVPQDDPPQAMPPPGRPMLGQGPGGQPHNPQDMLQQLRQQQMQQNQPQ